jgi:hypothetical protein
MGFAFACRRRKEFVAQAVDVVDAPTTFDWAGWRPMKENRHATA